MLAGIRNADQTFELKREFKLILIPFIPVSHCMGPWIMNKRFLGILRKSGQQIPSFIVYIVSGKYLKCFGCVKTLPTSENSIYQSCAVLCAFGEFN